MSDQDKIDAIGSTISEDPNIPPASGLSRRDPQDELYITVLNTLRDVFVDSGESWDLDAGEVEAQEIQPGIIEVAAYRPEGVTAVVRLTLQQARPNPAQSDRV